MHLIGRLAALATLFIAPAGAYASEALPRAAEGAAAPAITVPPLEPGKEADLVLWSGDPFEPLSQPRAIFINGIEQPLTARTLELRDRYMP
jgi:imidazolonepropionase-like amidohydrolase